MAHYQLARMLQHMQQPELCKQQLVLALQNEPGLEAAQKLLTLVQSGGEVQTVGYSEVVPEILEVPPPGRPMTVEVKPELGRHGPAAPPQTPGPTARPL